MDVLKFYDYQISNAEELVAEGGVFGQVQYQTALETIQNDIRKVTELSIAGLNQEVTNRRKEADRELGDKVSAIQQDYKEAMEESRTSANRTIAIANLEFLFRVNRGAVNLVVWNLPVDRKLHPRLSTFASVQLLLRDEVVWKSRGWRLSAREPRNVMMLPKVMFDSVKIEVSKWSGSGCGLAEVELWIGDKNVALARPCDVSSLETSPIHLDDRHALTDGITKPVKVGEGYWIPEESTKATVTIDLVGEKIERPALKPQP